MQITQKWERLLQIEDKASNRSSIYAM